MLIFDTSLDVVHSITRSLTSKLDMKDIDEVKVILNVKILWMSDSIMLSQEHCIEKKLKRFGHSRFGHSRLNLWVPLMMLILI